MGFEQQLQPSWLARDSERIWRGSYKNKAWKHLVSLPHALVSNVASHLLHVTLRPPSCICQEHHAFFCCKWQSVKCVHQLQPFAADTSDPVTHSLKVFAISLQLLGLQLSHKIGIKIWRIGVEDRISRASGCDDTKQRAKCDRSDQPG